MANPKKYMWAYLKIAVRKMLIMCSHMIKKRVQSNTIRHLVQHRKIKYLLIKILNPDRLLQKDLLLK